MPDTATSAPARRRRRTPGLRTLSQPTLRRHLNALLEGAYWPQSLETSVAYTRLHDDTDGSTSSEHELAVAISPDGDVRIDAGIFDLRFRTYAGGGQSLRVRNALLVLAEAIRRDNEEAPQRARRVTAGDAGVSEGAGTQDAPAQESSISQVTADAEGSGAKPHYTIVAYRWGYTNWHTYFVGQTADRDAALEIAQDERDGRGGKYGVQVLEWSDETDFRELAYYCSSWQETHPSKNRKIAMYEAIGRAAHGAVMDGKIRLPDTDWDPTTPLEAYKPKHIELPAAVPDWLLRVVRESARETMQEAMFEQARHAKEVPDGQPGQPAWATWFGDLVVRSCLEADKELEPVLQRLAQQAESQQRFATGEGADLARLSELADEFRRALPTHDGQVLAAMIEEGVTALESHIKYAFGRDMGQAAAGATDGGQKHG